MQIIDHIAHGHTVVCANAHLARNLRFRYGQAQLRQGKRAWESPNVLPFQAWLRRLREARGAPKDLLLNGGQEGVLWQQIIEGSEYRNRLLQVSSVAGQAAAAWQRLKQYRVPIFPSGVPMNEDTTAFRSWAAEFQSICRRNNWTDNASMVDALLPDVSTSLDACGQELALAGFDRLTPQQKTLFDALRAAGVSIHEYQGEARNESVRVATFDDVDEELRAAAVWARRLIEENPALTVGIITPNLRQLRSRIHYTLEDALAPGRLRYQDKTTPLPFSISVGQPLAEFPLVHVVFSLLGLSNAPLPLDVLGVLLRTPFIRDHNEEYSGRALLDEKLRARRQLAVSWDDLLYQTDKADPAVPVFAGMIRKLRGLLKGLPARQPPEEWAISFTSALEIWGWPGDRKQDSAEYQQVQAWHSALDTLVSLRVVQPQMTRGEALAHLRRSAEGTGFQPRTPETPIQVLDPQGAAALAFDRIWMFGLSEEAWPPRPRPNPFIPIALQRQYRMPGAAADDALEQASALQEALIRSTPRIILSHACNEAGRPLLESLLLQGLRSSPDTVQPHPDDPASDPALPEPAAPQPQVKTYPEVIFDSRALETIEDTVAPPVDGAQRGGADLFRDQSQCPFRAFARHRLQARQPEQADIGLDAMQRGSLLHQLMENTWSELKNQAKLAGMTGPEREDLVKTLVREVIRKSRRRYPLLHGERFAAIEAGRLMRILREWLELELQRAPFSVVGVETKIQGAIADVKFSARLDRIDELADGRQVIIDYKSGQASVYTWAGDRPDEPQLPLYALTHPEPVAAVAFARLKPGGDFGYAGLAETERILPGTPAFAEAKENVKKRMLGGPETPTGMVGDDWETLFDNWRRVLENLAREFHRGVATVTPKRGACDWCEQQPLCRIHEVNMQRKGQDG